MIDGTIIKRRAGRGWSFLYVGGRSTPRIVVLFLIASLLHLLLSNAFAGVPGVLNYQGKLTDSGGSPVTGVVDVAVAAYTNATNGAAVYNEQVGLVPVEGGTYSFQWGESGTSTWTVTEQLGIGDGTNSIFNYTVENPPIVNPSVTITDGTFSWNDVAGSSSPGNFLGTVSSYSNGQVSAVYLSGAPPAATPITVEYMYQTMGITTPLERSNEAWFEVSLDQSPLSPRTRLAAVPFSLMSASSINQMVPIGDWASGQAPSTGTQDVAYLFHVANGESYKFSGTAMPKSGSIRAVVIQIEESTSAGTCTAKVLIDGEESGASALLSTTSPTVGTATFLIGEYGFNAGSVIGLRLIGNGFVTSPGDRRRVVVTVYAAF